MKEIRSFGILWRILLLSVIGLAAQVAFNVLLPISEALTSRLSEAEQQEAGGVLLCLTLFYAAFISAIVRRSAGGGWKLIVRLTLILWGAQTFMPQIETLLFGSAFPLLSLPDLMILSFRNLLFLAIMIATAAYLFGKGREAPAPLILLHKKRLLSRLVFLGFLHLVFYFLFGYFIAWQLPALRQFYSGSTEMLPFLPHMEQVMTGSPHIVGMQFVRGLLWGGLGLWFLLTLQRGRTESILFLALLFGVFPSLQLFIPNPLMPEPVRLRHFAETASSLALFGAITGWLLWGAWKVRDSAAHS